MSPVSRWENLSRREQCIIRILTINDNENIVDKYSACRWWTKYRKLKIESVGRRARRVCSRYLRVCTTWWSLDGICDAIDIDRKWASTADFPVECDTILTIGTNINVSADACCGVSACYFVRVWTWSLIWSYDSLAASNRCPWRSRAWLPALLKCCWPGDARWGCCYNCACCADSGYGGRCSRRCRTACGERWRGCLRCLLHWNGGGRNGSRYRWRRKERKSRCACREYLADRGSLMSMLVCTFVYMCVYIWHEKTGIPLKWQWDCLSL